MKGSKKQMNVLKKVLKILLFMSVIMMTEGKELRIMSYNIYGSRLANGIKLGESIKKYRPDFVSLQEVDRDTKRSNFRDVTLDIASELGYNYYYFQKSRDFDSGEFGISFISKYPVEKIYAYELPSIGVEKRQVVIAELEKKEFGKKIMIINTHLDYKKEIKKEELESLSLLNGLFDSDIKFLSGDLNLLPNTEYYQTLTKEWKDSYFEGKDKEMRSIEDPRIDYIFGDYSGKWKVKKSFFIKDDTQDWTKLSDHFPYMSIMDIK